MLIVVMVQKDIYWISAQISRESVQDILSQLLVLD